MTMIGPATYGTSMPGSPIDGDFHILVDSTSNPSWQFFLRYNAGSASTFKWECIRTAGAVEGTTSLTIPRSGDYYVEMGGAATSYGASTNTFLQLSAGGITLQAAGGGQGGGLATKLYSVYDRGKMTSLSGGGALTPSQLGNVSPTRQFIRALPVRVI